MSEEVFTWIIALTTTGYVVSLLLVSVGKFQFVFDFIKKILGEK